MKRSTWITGATLALLLLLAGAAWVGGRLLHDQEPAPNAEVPQVSNAGDEGAQAVVAEVQLDPSQAEELPPGPRDVEGVFVRREDNSIFVGTGNLLYRAVQNSAGELEKNVNYDGLVVEIVTTRNTVVYRDVTSTLGGTQVVKPGSLDEIGAQTVLTVWGQRRGDRVTARVLVYRIVNDF